MSQLIISILTINSILINAIFIIDNGIDVRIVADNDEYCNIGRIEFYDGINWGSFSDCSMQMTNKIASSLCQTLGWDSAQSYHHGPYDNNPDRSIPEYTTYSHIYCPASEYENKDICDYDNDNHNNLFDCDICVNCAISNNLANNQCANISISELHSEYDMYVTCTNENSEANPLSNLYNCTDYTYESNTSKEIYNNEEWHLDTFGSCADAFEGEEEQHSNVWKLFAVVGIMIVVVVCVLIYCKATKRMPHKKFTEAYMQNQIDDDDIMLESQKRKASAGDEIGSKYVSMKRERKLSMSKEKLLQD